MIVLESGKLHVVSEENETVADHTNSHSSWIATHGRGVVSGRFVSCVADLASVPMHANPASLVLKFMVQSRFTV